MLLLSVPCLLQHICDEDAAKVHDPRRLAPKRPVEEIEVMFWRFAPDAVAAAIAILFM